MRQLTLLVLISTIITSCITFNGKRVSGNGNITTQDRPVGEFTAVEAGGSVQVHIRQALTTSVRIQVDENLQEYVETEVENGTLVVRTRNGYSLRTSKEIVVYTTAPVYKAVDVSGAGGIISDNTISGGEALEMNVSGSGSVDVQLALPKVSVDISGSGDVLLRGTAKEFDGSISGSGSIKAFELTTDNINLNLSGAAEAEVTANEKLDVKVSGSGDVRYKGNAQVSQSVSGSGSVKKV